MRIIAATEKNSPMWRRIDRAQDHINRIEELSATRAPAPTTPPVTTRAPAPTTPPATTRAPVPVEEVKECPKAPTTPPATTRAPVPVEEVKECPKAPTTPPATTRAPAPVKEAKECAETPMTRIRSIAANIPIGIVLAFVIFAMWTPLHGCIEVAIEQRGYSDSATVWKWCFLASFIVFQLLPRPSQHYLLILVSICLLPEIYRYACSNTIQQVPLAGCGDEPDVSDYESLLRDPVRNRSSHPGTN
jgi:hypothetical protein